MTNSYGKMRKKLQRTKELPGQISGAQLQIMVSVTIFEYMLQSDRTVKKLQMGK